MMKQGNLKSQNINPISQTKYLTNQEKKNEYIYPSNKITKSRNLRSYNNLTKNDTINNTKINSNKEQSNNTILLNAYEKAVNELFKKLYKNFKNSIFIIKKLHKEFEQTIELYYKQNLSLNPFLNKKISNKTNIKCVNTYVIKNNQTNNYLHTQKTSLKNITQLNNNNHKEKKINSRNKSSNINTIQKCLSMQAIKNNVKEQNSKKYNNSINMVNKNLTTKEKNSFEREGYSSKIKVSKNHTSLYNIIKNNDTFLQIHKNNFPTKNNIIENIIEVNTKKEKRINEIGNKTEYKVNKTKLDINSNDLILRIKNSLDDNLKTIFSFSYENFLNKETEQDEIYNK